MPRESAVKNSTYGKTNIRRVRKWKKKHSILPYLFLATVFIVGVVVTILVSRGR